MAKFLMSYCRFDRTLPYDDGTDGLHEGVLQYDEESMGNVNKALDVNELVEASDQAVALPMRRREANRASTGPKLDSDSGLGGGSAGKPTIISSGEIDATILPATNGATAGRRRRRHHRVHKLPNFPFVPDSMISADSIDVRKV